MPLLLVNSERVKLLTVVEVASDLCAEVACRAVAPHASDALVGGLVRDGLQRLLKESLSRDLSILLSSRWCLLVLLSPFFVNGLYPASGLFQYTVYERSDILKARLFALGF